MIYVTRNADGNIAGVSAEHSPKSECRWDWKTMKAAVAVADEATALTGRLHIAVDSGEWVSPRFDVIEAPTVGAKVSYTFNGDYYPCGQIARISKSLRVITTDAGKTFYRRRDSAAWVFDGMWSMVPGHINRLNPEF